MPLAVMFATAAAFGEPLLQSLLLVQSPETPLCQVLLLTLRSSASVAVCVDRLKTVRRAPYARR